MENPTRARSGKPPRRPRGRTYVDSRDLQSALARIRQAAAADRQQRFTALWHHVYNVHRLREAYFRLKPQAAPGVDGQTWHQYGQALESHLQNLSDRLKRGAYRARPVKRAWIPKADGRRRPIGVPTLEDKIVQRAATTVLQAVYEVDFLGFSYGFRPGRGAHDALDALSVALTRRKVNWILDADIRGFFDAISHDWLVKFVEHRIADRRVIRHVKKWLNAGVLEDGKRTHPEEGTPQGGSISPLLANVYLHYAFDLWAQAWRRRRARGEVIVVRYADDIVLGFQYESDAERFLTALRERFAKFNLELHADKTRLIEFGQYAAERRRCRGKGKPETFNFLGFTHICSRSRKGKFAIRRHPIQARMRAKLRELKEEFRRRLHAPVKEVGRWIQSVVVGWYRYFAVPRSMPYLRSFWYHVGRLWKRSLGRRSQKGHVTWDRMSRLIRRWLPPPRILHPYPSQRLYVTT